MDDVNWVFFPEPYNKELPLYFGKALEQFSSDEGLELLNLLLENARRQTTRQPVQGVDEEKAMALMEGLSDWEFQAFVALNRHLMKAMKAVMEQVHGEMALLREIDRLYERAQELDPTMPKDATLGEAVEVLRRHGEPLRISEEVLEMVLVIPPEGWREEE
jgi:hypothetical protein